MIFKNHFDCYFDESNGFEWVKDQKLKTVQNFFNNVTINNSLELYELSRK